VTLLLYVGTGRAPSGGDPPSSLGQGEASCRGRCPGAVDWLLQHHFVPSKLGTGQEEGPAAAAQGGVGSHGTAATSGSTLVHRSCSLLDSALALKAGTGVLQPSLRGVGVPPPLRRRQLREASSGRTLRFPGRCLSYGGRLVLGAAKRSHHSGPPSPIPETQGW